MPRPIVRPDDPIPALKRQLGVEIAARLQGWNADDIGAHIGTNRWRISELRRGKLARFSVETLIRYLSRLGCAVEVQVTKRPRAGAGARVRDESPTASSP
jgi:predicted XRE-type DNA-binding protein